MDIQRQTISERIAILDRDIRDLQRTRGSVDLYDGYDDEYAEQTRRDDALVLEHMTTERDALAAELAEDGDKWLD